MKEVKAFVDMMEQRTFKQGFASEMLEAIKESKEFQALKSLANAPKVEVTDEKWKMPVPEQGEYDWSKLNHGLYKIYWKDGGCSLASVGSLHSGKRWFAPCNWTSKDHSIASSAWNKVKDVERVEVDFDRDDEPKSESEKELISDGWIEWKGGLRPVDILTIVEIRNAGGYSVPRGNAGSFSWFWNCAGSDIIAYRIISEPEEEVCRCFDYEGSNFKCPLCKPEEKKEPKKQALIEYLDEWFEGTTYKHKADVPAYEWFVVASSYLEKNKVDK